MPYKNKELKRKYQDKKNAAWREWYKKPEVKIKVDEKRKLWREANKEKFLGYCRKSNLKTKYGMSLEEYNLMYEQQGGCCAICGIHERDSSGRWHKLHIDHSHITNKVRGLLCNDCNIGIGYLKDNPEILLNASRYLNER